MQGGKVLWLYVIGQLFNIALTFFAVWLLLSGKFFPVPELDHYSGKKAEPKVVEAPAPANAATQNSEALPADTISAAEALKTIK
jgi:membrane-associated protease RseP (regulator of RpoE activity)